MHVAKTTGSPAEQAGTYITQKLREHEGESRLLIVSSGSSIEVLRHIKPDTLQAGDFILLADERFTTHREKTNAYIVSQTQLYKSAVANGVSVLDYTPKHNESHSDWVARINKYVQEALTKSSYRVGLLGIDNSGNTASIFGRSEAKFKKLYEGTPGFVVTHDSKVENPERGTINVSLIKESLHNVVIYASGKQEILLRLQHGAHEHELPALVACNHDHSIIFTDAELLLMN